MRVCSLIPGATEVVAALGRADSLVGISHECDFPPEIRNKPVMVRATIETDHSDSLEIDTQVKNTLAKGGDLYRLDEDLFERAQPDIVITQELCQVCAVTPGQLQRALETLPQWPQVLSLNPTHLQGVLTDIERIGAAIGRDTEARAYAASLRARLHALQRQVSSASECPRVLCVEWLNPLYIAGHWIPDMVALAGGQDPLGSPGEPSRPVTWDQVVEAKPDVLVLMPCGFSIERTLHELQSLTRDWNWTALPAVRNGRVFAVDASSYFSRPGPRLVEGVAILASIIHPTLCAESPIRGVRVVDLFHEHRR